MVKVDAALNMDVITPRAAFYYAKGVVSPFGNYYPGLAIGHVLEGAGSPFAYSPNGVRMFNVGVDYVWNKFVFSLDGFSFQDRTAQDSGRLRAGHCDPLCKEPDTGRKVVRILCQKAEILKNNQV